MHFKIPQKKDLCKLGGVQQKAKVASGVKVAKEEESKVEEIRDEPVQPENVEKMRMTPQEKAQYMTEAIQQEYRQQFEAEARRNKFQKK